MAFWMELSEFVMRILDGSEWVVSQLNNNILTWEQILPTSLENLLLLNDKVQAYSVVHNQTRACYGCNKKSDSLKKCSKCGFFWYCNQVRDLDSIYNMDISNINRTVKLGAGMRTVTKRTAEFSRMRTSRGSFSSSGVNLRHTCLFPWASNQGYRIPWRIHQGKTPLPIAAQDYSMDSLPQNPEE